MNEEEYTIRPSGRDDRGRDTGADIEQALSERIARRKGQRLEVPLTIRQKVTLRLPLAVINHFKAKGIDWHEQLIGALEREVARAQKG